MEEPVVPKRPREESQVKEDVVCEESLKRHKPYNLILSLLESEEDDSTQDLSPLMTTLQQEITCASDSDRDTLLTPPQNNGQDNLITTTTTTTLEDCSTSTSSSTNSNGIQKEDEEDDKDRVMRHLLEASDDELGIPSRRDGLQDFGEDGFNGGDMFSFTCDGLWELEDETANYYAFLQSELFL